MAIDISYVGRARCRLGESPVWDAELKTLFWIDALGPTIWSLSPGGGEPTAIRAPDLVGNVVLGEPGALIVSMREDVQRLDLTTGTFSMIARAPDLGEGARLNDGKTDRVGRLLTGSMIHDPSIEPVGRLYRFDRDRPPEVLASGIAISNSLCFSPLGDRLYFADSLRQAIWSHAYDTSTGLVGPRSVLIDTASLGSGPDGATVDADGRLWVALVQCAQIACFSPEGRLERLIDTPIPYPSCPAFGGERLNTLYVTAIADSGGRLKTDHPDGGRLMAMGGLDAVGLAETRCRL
jgi:sugar lactone lactonase YvrE